MLSLAGESQLCRFAVCFLESFIKSTRINELNCSLTVTVYFDNSVRGCYRTIDSTLNNVTLYQLITLNEIMAQISSSTEENTEFEVPEFEVPKSFVSSLGSHETATCLYL